MSRLGITVCSLVLAGLIAGSECRAQEVSAGAGGVAVGGSISDSQINITGIPVEKLPSIIEAATKDWRLLNEQQKQTINSLQNSLGVDQDAMKSFFQTIGENEVPTEQLEKKLLEIAGHYRELLAQVKPGPDDGPKTAKIKTAAAQALKAGQFDRADKLLGQLQKLQDAALEMRQLERASTSAQRGQLAMTLLQYRKAAIYFAEAGEHVPSERSDIRLGYLDQEAGALYREGDERGDNRALAAAIERYNIAMTMLPRERTPLAWAAIQNSLGNALATLGARENGTVRLEKAVAAYRAALSECTRERAPLQWASTQLNLAAALVRLGEREIGTARLQEAVAAYRSVLETVAAYYAALEEDVHNRVPWIIWAVTQLNLGAALQTLGEREGGTAQLEEAVAAYSAALREYTRDRVPLQWALTQMNLGNVLRTLGERQSSTARLEEAVAAYRGTLEECTRERVPLDWAATQNNLGVVLWTLGKGDATTARLEEAVAAYRAALEEYTRERAPPQWAMTQNNLGIALKTLGERESGTARLEEAVAAYRAALEEYTPDQAPPQWAQTQMNLGNALQRLGERESGTARLEQAVAVYQRALELDPMPIDQANIEFNMGLALTTLGNKTHNIDSLKKALLCFRQACAVFRAAGMMQLSTPCDRAISPLQNDLEPGAPGTGETAKTSAVTNRSIPAEVVR